MEYTIPTAYGDLRLTDENGGEWRLLSPTGEALDPSRILSPPGAESAETADLPVLLWGAEDERTPEERAAAAAYCHPEEIVIFERMMREDRRKQGVLLIERGLRLGHLDEALAGVEVLNTGWRLTVSDLAESYRTAKLEGVAGDLAGLADELWPYVQHALASNEPWRVSYVQAVLGEDVGDFGLEPFRDDDLSSQRAP